MTATAATVPGASGVSDTPTVEVDSPSATTTAGVSSPTPESLQMTSDDVAEFADALRHFATHVTARLFGSDATEGPDGDLERIPELLGEARAMGLIDDPAGFGVWGPHVLDHGTQLSLMTLSVLGEACAGFGAVVHAHGLGTLIPTAVQHDRADALEHAASIVAAAFVPPAGVVFDPRTATESVALVARDGTPRLHGSSPYVWSPARPDSLVVVARNVVEAQSGTTTTPSSWAIVQIPAESAGVQLESVGHRVGLRAVDQLHVTFDSVTVPDDAVLATGDQARTLLTRMVACDWLGVAALSLGTARAALRHATAYADTRHQGGAMIARHASVQLLLGEATHHVASMTALLNQFSTTPLGALSDDTLMGWALSARLGIVEHTAVATTNAMQVLGGYGYMDDYGISKRLRDISALRSRHGSREQLLLLLNELRDEGVG